MHHNAHHTIASLILTVASIVMLAGLAYAITWGVIAAYRWLQQPVRFLERRSDH